MDLVRKCRPSCSSNHSPVTCSSFAAAEATSSSVSGLMATVYVYSPSVLRRGGSSGRRLRKERSLCRVHSFVSEQLERIPATYKVIRHVRPKFACAGCERVVEAPAPARPIERGLPGPNLLAHVLVSKIGDHVPLYRQSEMYAREGIDLDRSTLAGWVGAASELLAPLVDEIRKHVLAASKIHADDTPVPVLAPGNGKTRTGRLMDVCAR
jgi:transposase